MTEEEWLTATDPVPMVWLIRKKQGIARRQRLVACACYRASWEMVGDKQFDWVIEFGERFADGEFDSDAALATLEKASERARAHVNPQSLEELHMFDRMIRTVTCVSPHSNVPLAFLVPEEPTSLKRIRNVIRSWFRTPDREEPKPPIWCHLIRDIFGNPFRPISFLPEWRTSTVLALAQGIYEERAIDRMPILADALQDCGCDNEDILNHCRDEKATHVRGCWVVDLVLGKE
jgi:hypothetical protein